MQLTTQLISSQTTIDDATIERVFGRIMLRGLELTIPDDEPLAGPDGEWKTVQTRGRLGGLPTQGYSNGQTFNVGSPDEIEELLVSLPWPAGDTVKSTQELLLTERGGLLLRVREFAPTDVTITHDVRSSSVLHFVPQKSTLSEYQAVDIGRFQATVNGELVGGWGVASVKYADPNEVAGTVDDQIIGWDVQPDLTPGAVTHIATLARGVLIIDIYGEGRD